MKHTWTALSAPQGTSFARLDSEQELRCHAAGTADRLLFCEARRSNQFQNKRKS